jgi:putative transposase
MRTEVGYLRSTFGPSERRACELMEIAVSSYRYRSRRQGDGELREKLVALAGEKPRFGYRRLHVLLKRSGERVNHKRVWRVYREVGLCVKRKKRKRLVRRGLTTQMLSRANQEWALDFVHDVLGTGQRVRALSVLDAYTRECLALEVDTSFASRRVTRGLERLIAERGRPESLRCDNGPELTSRHFLAWCVERKIQLVHIEPGRPMQNGRVESFQGKFRDECLNVSWFRNLWEAREKVESWRREYKEARPHSSLGYQTPEAFAASQAEPPASPPTLAGTSKTGEKTSLSSMNFVSPSVRT